MPLNDVKFVTTAGGLGRLPAGEDYISAIIIDLSASPGAWADSLGKKYVSPAEAEGDGIVDGDANYGILHYMISEFFRMAGASELWVINEGDGDFTAQNVYNLTDGKIRQAYWYSETAYAGLATLVGTIKAFVDAMAALHAPMVAFTSVKDEATAVNGTAQTDLRTLNAPEVSVLICGSGSGKGGDIADDLSVNYIPAGGAVLGAMASAQVHLHIGWVERFNFQSGTTDSSELKDIVFSDGQNFKAVSDAVLTTLNTKGYLFLRKHNGVAGSYVNDTHTATLASADLATIENNRTLQKGKREIRTALIPKLNSPLTVDDDGKLSADTIVYFENLATKPLQLMQNAGELSGFEVIIDPDQNVLATSELAITVNLQPRGVARNIKVTIGFQANVA